MRHFILSLALIAQTAAVLAATEPAAPTATRGARSLSAVFLDLSATPPTFATYTAVNDLTALLPNDPKADMTPFLPAAPHLVSLVGYGGPARFYSQQAERILVRLGRPALPTVVKVMRDAQAYPGQRDACARVLTAVDPDQAVSLLPDLLDAPNCRREAVICLGNLGKLAGPVTGKVKEHLDDSDPFTRINARVALIRITGKTDPYLADLAAVALEPAFERHHEWGDVPGAAAEAVWALGDLGKPAHPAFIKALSDPDKRVRRLAASAFNKKGPESSEVVAALAARLAEEPDPAILTGVVGGLATIGPPAKPAVPALAKILAADDPQVGPMAVLALACIGTDDAISALLPAVRSRHRQTRLSLASTLDRAGRSNPDAVRSALVALTADSDPEVAKAAQTSLAAISQRRPAP